MSADTLVRISSNTKPMAAALALVLAEDGLLSLTDPVERLVPELAGRRVLRRADGPLDDTVPAERPVTVADLLTMRLGRRAPSALAFLGGGGWGYGVQVLSSEYDASVRLPRYGWGGGLGTLWYSWPDQRTAAVLLTQVLPPSSELSLAFTSAVETVLHGPCRAPGA